MKPTPVKAKRKLSNTSSPSPKKRKDSLSLSRRNSVRNESKHFTEFVEEEDPETMKKMMESFKAGDLKPIADELSTKKTKKYCSNFCSNLG